MPRSGYDVTGCRPRSAAYDNQARNRNRNQISLNTATQAQSNEVATANHIWTAPQPGPIDEQAPWRLASYNFSLDHRPSHDQKVSKHISVPRSDMSYYPMGGASIGQNQATNADSFTWYGTTITPRGLQNLHWHPIHYFILNKLFLFQSSKPVFRCPRQPRIPPAEI